MTDRPLFYDDLSMHTYPIEGGYEHIDMERSLTVITKGLRQNGHGLEAEVDILYPDDSPIKRGEILKLQDSKAKQALIYDLAALPTDEALPWDKIIEYVCFETITRFRSVDTPDDISREPETSAIEYAIQDILPMCLPTTIFSPGGKGKSIFADYIAVIYEYGYAGNLPFLPREGHVLYLDWETEAEIHRKYVKAIKAGLGIAEHREIKYLSCYSPLANIIDSIREIVVRNDIELVIIDSQMAATAGAARGETEAQISSEYYNCLNSPPVSKLLSVPFI